MLEEAEAVHDIEGIFAHIAGQAIGRWGNIRGPGEPRDTGKAKQAGKL
jgi:hypothetical protein